MLDALGDVIDVLETVVLEQPVPGRNVSRAQTIFPNAAPQGIVSSMDEFGAELDRCSPTFRTNCQDPPTKPVPRLEHDNLEPTAAQFNGGGQAGHSASDHDDIAGCFRHDEDNTRHRPA